MGSISLTNFLYPIKNKIEDITTPIVIKLSWINPSLSSFLNFLFMVLGGISLGLGYSHLITVFLLILSYSFDVLDGMLARSQRRQSQRGTFIDGSFDRLGEIGFIIGLYYSQLFREELVFFLGLSALFTNYLHSSLVILRGNTQRSILEKSDRSIYFVLILVLLHFQIDSYLEESFTLLCVISLMANIQLILRGMKLKNKERSYFSIPSNPDETTFHEDYNGDPYYGEGTAT